MNNGVSENTFWVPSPKQELYLQCDDDEVLYGGAAGGGKSDAMLVDGWCLQHDGPANKNLRSILFRRTFPELKDLIERSHELFPKIVPGARYNEVKKIWRAPSGALFEFGHMHHDMDRFKYRGRAFNWIGFEELTLWATNVCYEYLKSRLRTVDKTLPQYIRSSTNPDGPGQKWVMQHWNISEQGLATRRYLPLETEVEDADGNWTLEERLIVSSFIPAKLSDNKHLRGTGYRERLMSLSPEEREALLDGLWRGNAVKGAFYFSQMQEVRAQGRITKIPYIPGIPVNTFWDLGANDTTAIWFHQLVGMQNRFIRSYENSGQDIEHYAKICQDTGYVFGTHYLPHDANQKRLGSKGNKTLLQLFKEAMPGHKFTVVPVTPRVIVGVNQTRKVFPTACFDEENCKDGIAALDAYRKKWDQNLGSFTQEHIHDWSSNYADAFRQFGQGYEPAQKHQEPPGWQKKISHTLNRKTKHPMAS